MGAQVRGEVRGARGEVRNARGEARGSRLARVFILLGIVWCAFAGDLPASSDQPSSPKPSSPPRPSPLAPRPSSYALIVTGASGSDEHGQQQRQWREALVEALRDHYGTPTDRIVVLSEDAPDPAARATRTSVRRAIRGLASRLTATDVVLVVLIGHSSFDGVDAKFNLVGPDMEAGEWNQLLTSLAGRVVFVNTTGGSSPFIKRLAARNRVVITATHSPAQKYDTVFPQFWVEALASAETDLDRNGRISVWEAFARASSGVRR